MLHLVIAMPCEARPFIARYRLQPASSTPFRLYRGDGVYLIVSGIGKIASAAATAYLYAVNPAATSPMWLNVGVAGHAEFPIGKTVNAARITDQGSGKAWSLPHGGGEVLTVDRPQETYESPWIYEMEAAGFCSTATRLAPVERIHCLKIISDNRRGSIRNITADLVSKLIADNLSAVDELTAPVIGKTCCGAGCDP